MANIFSKAVSTVKHWWLFLLTGILLIVGSIWVFLTPVESYVNLAWIFSILVLVTGISYVIFSISNRKELEEWGWYLTGGIFEIVMGIILVSYPDLTIIMLPLFVGFWLMFRGAQIIAASPKLKEYRFINWGWLMLLGIALTIVSFLMILDPLFGFLNVVYITSVALLLLGIANIMLSLKLKEIKAKTIDKVEEFKKNINKGLKDLKTEVIKNIKEATADQKSEIDAAFEDYKSKMD